MSAIGSIAMLDWVMVLRHHRAASGGGVQGEVFEEAAAFAGSRPGFVFKMGSLGLGCYTDKPVHMQEIATAAQEEEDDEPAPTKLNPDPAPRSAPPPVADTPAHTKELLKLPFNNTLVYDPDRCSRRCQRQQSRGDM